MAVVESGIYWWKRAARRSQIPLINNFLVINFFSAPYLLELEYYYYLQLRLLQFYMHHLTSLTHSLTSQICFAIL